MFARHYHPIVAIATAPGRGAVGMVRVSGRDLSAVIAALCNKALQPRMATYLPFLDASGEPIDKGLAIHFPAPHSYTGEDVLELQAHGGPVVLQLLLARCLQALPALRVAQPGEFTERAFLNDKIDLTQAEAIADLIDASTETAARSAARSMSGEFSNAVNAMLAQLIHLRMLVEATLDFPEEDIDFLQKADAQGQLVRLQTTLAAVTRNAQQGSILREGIKVVIAGQPNAGKSSLLNALAGAELAIVTPIAGTTRDKVTELIQIDGVPLHMVDTAGLREALDEVEKIGVERAWAEIQSADAVLFLHDLTQQSDIDYIAADARIQVVLASKLPSRTPIINVWNKSDAVDSATAKAKAKATATATATAKATATATATPSVTACLTISAKTGDGLQALRAQLLGAVGWQSAPEGLFMARERHLLALAKVDVQLAKAADQLRATNPALDLLAEDLRQAQLHLGEITGQFTADDLLGEIFSKFCIGK
jgi:tRNA modification GTPase